MRPARAHEARDSEQERPALRSGIAILLLSSLYCIGLEWARVVYTGDRVYLSLIWNLFLAWIPFAVSLLIEKTQNRGGRPALLVLLAAIWLLFFPNAPYIITDFVHLTPRGAAPLWFDVLLIASFAWTGLLLGLVSLARVQRLISSVAGSLVGWLSAAAALLLASFGIYIGRFEVRNSWDIVLQPGFLVRDTWHQLTSPALYPRTLGVTFSYAIFLILTYATICEIGGLLPTPRRFRSFPRGSAK